MKLIVGLGNVGKKYEHNRHNMGFLAIDFFTKKKNITLNKNKFNGAFYKGENFIIGKPHTFMNLSGDFVYDLCQFYKISDQDILIIHDDMDLEVGQLRYREAGSSGGHNGINDVMVKLDTNKIKRLKIGIGRPLRETTNFVLSNFKKEEWEKIAMKENEITNFIWNFITDKN